MSEALSIQPASVERAYLTVVPVEQESETDSWHERAACRPGNGVDPETFFPEKGRSDRVKAAKEICSSCVVRNVCLQYALDNDERFGVWGGLSERDRRRLKRRY